MGKGNKPKPETQYNTALVEAKKPSAAEEALTKSALKTLQWAEGGDFTNPREGGLFVNYADPAIARRNRELQTNAGGQGIFALGQADPNYLATVRANRMAEDEATDAAQYEGDIKEGISRAAGVAGDVAGMDIARKQNILGTTSGVYQSKQNQPKWWQYLISGAQSGLSAAGI